MRGVIEHINKSPAKQAFDESTFEEFGRFLKLKNAPTHRWSSNEIVLERVLKLWQNIEVAYASELASRSAVQISQWNRQKAVDFFDRVNESRLMFLS
jgi:hypothetical protein